jgi:hypothetical protein
MCSRAIKIIALDEFNGFATLILSFSRPFPLIARFRELKCRLLDVVRLTRVVRMLIINETQVFLEDENL